MHVADIAANSEIILVSNISGTTWTVTRGAEGTTPVAHSAGFTIYQVTSAGALQQLFAVDWLNVVTMFGADPTGAADSTTAIQDALNAVPAAGGVIYLPAGTYKVSSTLTNNVTPTYIAGDGRWATQVSFTGTGDCIRMFNPYWNSSNSSTNQYRGGGVKGLTIDGTSAGAGSCGLHIGDGEQYDLDVAVQNFTGTGSIGTHFDNTIWWTEKIHGSVYAANCANHVVFDVTNPAAYTGTTLVSASGGVATFTNAGGWNIPGTTVPLQAGQLLLGSAGLTTPQTASVSTLTVTSVSGTTLTCAYTGTAPSGASGTLTVVSSTNSFGYSDLTVWVRAAANQNGVIFQNGALLYHGSLTIRGNFVGSASAQSSYVLTVTGTIPNGNTASGTYSRILRSRLDIAAETTAGANQPGTILIGAASNNMVVGCYGVMDFGLGGATFTPTNAPANSSQGTFWYMGFIAGDNNLNSGNIALPVTLGGLLYSQAGLNGATGNLNVNSGDFFRATLSASITVNLNAAGSPPSMPQRKTVIITQAASGGPYTVTWPHAGSPTTSSPAVYWAGGTAPVMSTGAGAVDVYKLETYDGARWYGQALQNVS
jgi:hypothetical protein